MATRSALSIRSAALAVLEARGSGVRTDAGEPIVDVVDATAIEASRTSVVAEYLRRINSRAGWLQIISDDGFKRSLADAYGIGFDRTTADFVRAIGAPSDISSDVEALIHVDLGDYAASFGRPRRPATSATTTMRLTLSSSGAFSLARGATVRRGAVLYDSTEDLSLPSAALDLATGTFYADVAVRCRTPGRVGNAIRGSINASSGTLPGVTSVRNITVAEGGFERETNASLLAALESILSGTNINTRDGLLNFVKAQANVADAILVKPGDPLMTRSAAGAVDVYVVGSRVTTQSAVDVIATAGEAFTLPLQPVLGISSAVDDSANAFFDGGGFRFVQDTGPSSGSMRSHAQIIWDRPPPDGVGPEVGARVSVFYTHDALPRDIQRKLDEDPHLDVPASNNLIRLATRVGVTCQLAVVPIAGLADLGFTPDDVDTAVENALTDYFDALKLGALGEFSDALVAAAEAKIGDVAVVDRVDDFVMSRTGGVGSSENIAVAPNEYLRLDAVDLL